MPHLKERMEMPAPPQEDEDMGFEMDMGEEEGMDFSEYSDEDLKEELEARGYSVEGGPEEEAPEEEEGMEYEESEEEMA